MWPCQELFEERLSEIEAYLDLLAALEEQTHLGPPMIGGRAITVQQQKILYSSVYLQLYNLVEATATWCVDEVALTAASDDAKWKPGDLSDELRREWVRTNGRTHQFLNEGNRLDATVQLCDSIIQGHPLQLFVVEKGGGGNWDDRALEAITDRLGCELRISEAVSKAAKRIIRDDKGSLALVKYLRNRLAHGNLSFEECGTGITIAELRDIKDRTANYLREVIASFVQYLENFEYVQADRRPFLGAFI
jgi:hypothetical protein